MNLNPIKVIERKIITLRVNVADKQMQQVGIDLTIKGKGDFVITAGEFRHIECNEVCDMQEYMGLIYIRSSYSRMGIFSSSGVYDPGYKGSIGVTIYNMSSKPIIIKQNSRIAQFVVYIADASHLYDGYYNNTTDQQTSKLEKGNDNEL